MTKKSKLTIGLLHSTIRGDEKLLIKAARKRQVDIELVDVRHQVFNPEKYQVGFDIALERSISTVKGLHAIRFFESLGVPTVNTSSVANLCWDKFNTSLVLEKAGVPTVAFSLAFNEEQALEAVEQLGGFPVVIKPVTGSWGRLLAKVNDRDSLEAVLEHKDVLGSPDHKAFYIQEYIDKPGRDIRTFVIDGKTICAIYRSSKHWITNTARGGRATNCPVNRKLAGLCRQASKAVGGGVLAIDVFETDEDLVINEINHTMEFKNSEKPTGVSISGAVIDYCIKLFKNKKKLVRRKK